MNNEVNYMENFHERVAKYDALIIEADDLIEQDINKGIIKIDNSVFDGFAKNAVINIYCSDINADAVMEFVMKAEDSNGVVMELIDCFNV